MAITLTNEGGTILHDDGKIKISIVKKGLQINLLTGGAFTLVTSGRSYRFNFSDVLSPSTAGAEELRVLLNAWRDVNTDLTVSASTDRQYGANEAVGNTFEPVWNISDAFIPLTTADNFRVKAGGNAADAVAGAGARSVKFTFLDSTFALVSETIATAGAAASASTSSTGFRLLLAEVIDSGTTQAANSALMTLETAGGTDIGEIPVGLGITQMSMFTVPAGKTMYVQHVDITVGAGDSAVVRLFQTPNADVGSAPFSSKNLVVTYPDISGINPIPMQRNLVFPEKTDLLWEAKATTTTTSVSITMHFILVNT